MSEGNNVDLSSGLGLACRIALDVLNTGGHSESFNDEV